MIRSIPGGFAARSLGSFALALGIAACGGGAPMPAPAPPEPEAAAAVVPPDQFSGQRALGELELLSAFGPRGSTSEGAVAARQHLRAALEEEQIRVQRIEAAVDVEGEVVPLPHLVAELPGPSPDRFVLVAPYDFGSASGGAADELSGAAVLLELARVLGRRDFPYTLEFVWLAGESGLGDPAGPKPPTVTIGSPADPPAGRGSAAARWRRLGRDPGGWRGSGC